MSIDNLTEKEQEARSRICLAVDVNVDNAIDLAKELGHYVGMFKVGKQLHTSAGNQGENIVQKIWVQRPKDNGNNPNVFLDLKYHDTPDTVYDSAIEAAVNGVYMFNIHISGGEKMCKKAIEGAKEGASYNKIATPKVIGVTELTSIDDSDLQAQGISISYEDLVKRRTEQALEWGLEGIVCPAKIAGALEKEYGAGLIKVTPGIKWKGIKNLGQKQLYTPDKAVEDCKNSILVIGSAITKAENKVETAYEIIQAMAAKL